MASVDPLIFKSRARIKSASVETSSQPSPKAIGGQAPGFDHEVASIQSDHDELRQIQQQHRNQDDADNQNMSLLAPGSLKPSASTSCLLTTETNSDSSSSNALVCIPTRASLTHEWKKLKTPNKCRECNLLVYFNGRECSFCGYIAHKKCVTILVIKCSGQHVATSMRKANRKTNDQPSVKGSQTTGRKGRPNVQPIFGQHVESVDSRQVVDFLRRFVYEIDTRGLTSKGIYRVSSIKSKVDKLCNYYDQNLSSLVDLSSFHPNIIANALKMYLRQLPEPLLTHELYEKFIEVAKKYPTDKHPAHSQRKSQTGNRDNPKLENGSGGALSSSSLAPQRQRKCFSLTACHPTSYTANPNYDPMLIVELREIIELLPPINQDLIAIIMRHLKRVSDMADENQMSATNLSIIFGPTLLSANNKSLAIVDNVHQARVVEIMILWADQIFPQYENYESKAVIELDISDDEEYQSREAFKGSSRSLNQGKHNPHTSKVDESCKDNKSNTKESLMDQVSQSIINQAVKTRKDLREMRRQFFNSKSSFQQVNPSLLEPAVKTNPLSGQIKRPETGSTTAHRTVPVIQVQSFNHPPAR